MSDVPRTPSYRLHRASGRAFVKLSGRCHYLGRYDTPESKQRYRQLIAEYHAAGGHVVSRTPDVTIKEVLAAYSKWAETYYQPTNGRPNTQLDRVLRSLAAVRTLYGELMARDFGPLALQAVRQTMIDQGLNRRTINHRIGCIKRAFKWATSQELIPVTVYQSLLTVDGLRKDRSIAPEPEPVRPASEEAIAGALAHLGPVLADAARLQLLTGARPGEVLALKASHVDRSSNPWKCKPPHKMSYLGRDRIILAGPRAQEIITRWLRRRCPVCGIEGVSLELAWREGLCGPCADHVEDEGICGPWPPLFVDDEDYYLFSPRMSIWLFRRQQRAARRTRVQPSQIDRSTTNPKKSPGDRYQTDAYAQAIRKACQKAQVEHWHPHQLRHNAATLLRAEFGLEVARQVLGHGSMSMTELYAEPDLSAGMHAILRVG